MNKHFYYWKLTVVLILCACAPTPNVRNIKSTLPATQKMADARSSVTPQHVITSTTQLTPTQITNLVPPTTAISTPISNIAARSTYPEPIPIERSSILSQGSLLFTYFENNILKGIWSVNESGSEPNLLLEENTETGLIVFPVLSHDGRYLAWAIHRSNGQAPLLAVFDLQTNEFYRYEVGVPWERVRSFTENHLIVLRQGLEILPDEIKIEIGVFDPSTSQIENAEEVLSLPDYFYLETMDSVSALSIRQDGRYAVYTAEEENGISVLLRDLQKEINLWEFIQNWAMPLPHPEWSQDGTRVALSIWDQENNDRSAQILILNTVGQSQRLVPQVFLEDYSVNELSWSPDGRYLYFALGHAPILDGGVFFINLDKMELFAICDPFVDEIYPNGMWIGPDNQFAYSVLTKDGNAELRILDVERWQWQTAAVIEQSTSLNPFPLYGWTPLNLP